MSHFNTSDCYPLTNVKRECTWEEMLSQTVLVSNKVRPLRLSNEMNFTQKQSVISDVELVLLYYAPSTRNKMYMEQKCYNN